MNMPQSVFKDKKRKAKKKKMKGYNQGGVVTKRGIMPTNQKTVQATGMGAATRGGNFKV
tara:strand:- start:1637 stop:1813 length:177 start_codon:yes stop_codon:yes gene_type:complete